jgi:hypothetical protein
MADAGASPRPGLSLSLRVAGKEGVLSLFEGRCDDGWGFLLTVVERRLEEVHAQPFMTVADDILARREKIRIAHDWEAMTSYASSVRRDWTAWAGSRLKGLPDVHFLVGGKLIAMGIATASLGVSLLGGPRMLSHWSWETFEEKAFARLDPQR